MRDCMISVITVAKDAEQTIGSAIESVLLQTYRNIEYIFVVSKSNDNTDGIIESYKALLSDRGIIYKHISEPDTGIYNAMNKGIYHASGEWVYFLNADDRLRDDLVFENVFFNSCIDLEKIDCIYGNIVLADGKRIIVRKGSPVETIYYKFPFSHQAFFVKRATILHYMFDEKYNRLADFKQFSMMYLDHKKFEYVNVDVALFSMSGASQKDFFQLMLEREKIHRELGMAEKKRMKRWIRYFFICVIKGNNFLFRIFFFVNEKIQKIGHWRSYAN